MIVRKIFFIFFQIIFLILLIYKSSLSPINYLNISDHVYLTMPVVSMKQMREESENENEIDRPEEQDSDSDQSSDEESLSSPEGSDSEDSSGIYKLIYCC